VHGNTFFGLIMIKISNLFAVIIFFRLIVDLIFVNEKPVLIQMAYIFLVSVFCAAVLVNNKVKEAKWLFLFFAISMWTLYRSDGAILDQFLYNIKIILVALFLLCVPYTKFNIKFSLDLFRKFAVYIVLIGFAYTIFSNSMDISTFDNNPMHSISQVIAKTSLAYIGAPLQYLFAFIYMLYYLNVRSNFIPILIIAMVYLVLNVRSRLARFFLVLMSVVTTAELYASGYFDFFVKRIIFRGKESMDFYTASSGRDEIFSYYIDYIAERFTLVDYLFGRGSPALRGELIFATHSDLLGLFVNYGLFGLLLSLIMYVCIFRRVSGEYKLFIIFYFIFVALTNGVVFHQSTILLALFFGNKFKASNNDNYVFQSKNILGKNLM